MLADPSPVESSSRPTLARVGQLEGSTGAGGVFQLSNSRESWTAERVYRGPLPLTLFPSISLEGSRFS